MQNMVKIISLRHGQCLRPTSPPDSPSLNMKQDAACYHLWMQHTTSCVYCVCRM
jgi:hypothetical protein